jgi:hypothetical protein
MVITDFAVGDRVVIGNTDMFYKGMSGIVTHITNGSSVCSARVRLDRTDGEEQYVEISVNVDELAYERKVWNDSAVLDWLDSLLIVKEY